MTALLCQLLLPAPVGEHHDVRIVVASVVAFEQCYITLHTQLRHRHWMCAASESTTCQAGGNLSQCQGLVTGWVVLKAGSVYLRSASSTASCAT